MTRSKHIHGDVPHVPSSVRRYFARLAKKANAKMRGTSMAKKRARKAAKTRWRKK